MRPTSEPIDFKLPDRPWPYGIEDIIALSKSIGLTDPEGLTVELQNWAAAEWISLTRSAKRQIQFKGLDEAAVWPSIRKELLTRHRLVWGPYSEV